MKKFTLFLFALLMISFSVLAQIKLVVCQEGGIRSEFIASNVDSIIFVGLEDTPSDPVKPDTPVVPGTGSFVAKPFSVSATKTVTFSPGNLQYHAANDEWRFAPNQTDYVGADNANISPSYNGWIDLFGWGTGNNPTNKSQDCNDYQTFVDWGVNKIGNYAPNTWRTLTYDEWYYLRNERPNHDKLIGVAQVNGVNGLILLPDSWQCPSGVTFKSGFDEDDCTECYGNYQTISVADWSKLEASGAVFFPAAGYCTDSDVYEVQYVGGYWSATEDGSNGAYLLYFNSDEARMFYDYRFAGLSVRLVQYVATDPDDDPVAPPVKPDDGDDDDPVVPETGGFVAKPFSVSENKTVTFSPGNLQYHAANNEWRFAPNQTDYIGEANDNISSTYNGWIDLFGWGTGNNPTNASEDKSDYQTFVDWGVNKIGNYAPNTWRTLTYAEWEYLIEERPNYDKLIAVAQVNGVNGLILLPDGWTCPSGVTFKSGFHDYYGTDYYAEYQTFSASDWSKLESSGAVFFPAAGFRRGSNVLDTVQGGGYYWSATENYSDFAYFLCHSSGGASMSDLSRYIGHSVRLVQDVATDPDDDPVVPPVKPDDGDDDDPVAPETGGFVAKPFSVSATKTVTFSPGNLQYHPANNEWRFAPNQTDYIGEDNANISATYNGWIDLFGWGTGNNPTNKSTDYGDYQTFVDWGVNKIGSYSPNTWRTLTYDEWYYLRYQRPNYDKLIGVAQVNGVHGLILLPDAWVCPSGVTFKAGFLNDWCTECYDNYQTISALEWSKLEASGAVFLPAAGLRYGSSVGSVQGCGAYWSATEGDSDNAYYLRCLSYGANTSGCYRIDGHSVRLVQD